MKNYTKEFINLVDKTVILYEDSFNKLEEFENKDIHINQIEKYFFDGFSINSKNDNSYNKHIEEYIKTFDIVLNTTYHIYNYLINFTAKEVIL